MTRFFKKIKEIININDLLRNLTVNVINHDNDLNISDIENLSSADSNHLTIFSDIKYIDQLRESRSKICLIDKKLLKYINDIDKTFLVSENIYHDLAKIILIFYSYDENKKIYNISNNNTKLQSKNFSDTSIIGDNVKIGNNVLIGSNTIIGDNVTIGDNSVIGSNCTIICSEIGNNVEIGNNCSIGQEGFGYVHDGKKFIAVPQIGAVIINNLVSIGSNVCIDRGSIDNTKIGMGTKIDNLVHIAHNVEIGSNCLITAQVGFAGSSKIGDNVVFGGQAGISGHIKIGSNNRFAAKSGVTKNIPDNAGDFYGMPAISKDMWQKEKLILRKMAKNGN